MNTGAMKRLLGKAEKPKVSVVFHLEKDYLHVHESVCNVHTLLPLIYTPYQSLMC